LYKEKTRKEKKSQVGAFDAANGSPRCLFFSKGVRGSARETLALMDGKPIG